MHVMNEKKEKIHPADKQIMDKLYNMVVNDFECKNIIILIIAH